MTVKEHYDNHLGYFYSWMLGDFDTRQIEQEEYFSRNCIFPKSNKLALDLGAGNGIQSISLSKLGFEVKAIDFNAQLTNELDLRCSQFNIEVIRGDITDPTLLSSYSPELVVCMGDTISHLESIDHLTFFFKNIQRVLDPGGLFIVSYRDFTKELNNEQRFIPVKSDQTRILTCFLEYFPDYLKVTDILHEFEDGVWVQKVSSYKKLRLSLDVLRCILTKSDLNLLKIEFIRGMNYMILEKK